VLDRIWQNWGLWAAHRKLPSLVERLLRRGWQHLHGAAAPVMDPAGADFCVLQAVRQPGKFRQFCDRVGFEPMGVCGSYESQTAAAAEITDDSDGLVEAIADSTTTEITDDSNGREVAIAIPQLLWDVAGSAFGMEFMNGSKALPTRQAPTQVVNEAIEAYLKNQSQDNFRLAIKIKIDGSTATTSDHPPLSCKTRKFC